MRARFAFLAIGFPVGLFVGMMVCLELGRRVGLEQAARFGDASRVGVGVVDGAVYGVLALLLGFMFSGATSRFDNRRQLMINEVTALHNAWFRLDTLPDRVQSEIRATFRAFVDALIAWYAKPVGSADSEREYVAATQAGRELWDRSVATALSEDGEKSRMLVLPALNEMYMAVDRERLGRHIHPPVVIYVMLAIAAMAAALFAGYSMANTTTRNWVFMLGVATTIAIVTYVIIDLEFPRVGLVRVDRFDRALVEMRKTMT